MAKSGSRMKGRGGGAVSGTLTAVQQRILGKFPLSGASQEDQLALAIRMLKSDDIMHVVEIASHLHSDDLRVMRDIFEEYNMGGYPKERIKARQFMNVMMAELDKRP